MLHQTMKNKLTSFLLLAAIFYLPSVATAYEAHDVYQTGDTHLVNFNLVLSDLSLVKSQLFFPTEQDLKDWLLENKGSKTRIHQTPGRIKRELQYQILEAPESVTINEHNRFPPYYVAYLETDDAGQTWKVRCEWTSLMSLNAIMLEVVNSDNKQLLEMPPLEVSGLDFQFVPGADKVVIIEP
jgi:hypothetical protein